VPKRQDLKSSTPTVRTAESVHTTLSSGTISVSQSYGVRGTAQRNLARRRAGDRTACGNQAWVSGTAKALGC
jgi:hypothetical protein